MRVFTPPNQWPWSSKETRKAYKEIETEHLGYPGSQDTYFVGTIKGLGRMYTSRLSSILTSG